MINMTTQNVNKIWVLLAKRKQKGYCIDQTGTSQILMVTQSPGYLVKNADFTFNVLPGDVDTANLWITQNRKDTNYGL